jgi:two-component system sensor histidine kinase BaeS
VVTGGIGWLLLVGAGCLAVAALVAYWLARRFSKPLAEAAATTERIAAGDLGTTMPIREPPEMAALATSINVMTDRLREARDQERRFLLSVSHDLRTPLTSIRGYAEAIADGAATDPGRAAGVIIDETARLERLVQDLLDLARLGAHRFGLKVGPVDVTELARTVAERFATQAAGAGVNLEVLTSEPLWVVADGDRLVQVLHNLLDNAFAFAQARIGIGAQRSGDQAVLWVADDGAGISPDLLAHVFEPHFTSDRSSARRNGSRTGLGLAIVAELAQAMGGGVRAESPVAGGVGTRLTVWLPLSPSRAAAFEPRSALR